MVFTLITSLGSTPKALHFKSHTGFYLFALTNLKKYKLKLYAIKIVEISHIPPRIYYRLINVDVYFVENKQAFANVYLYKKLLSMVYLWLFDKNSISE